MKEGGLLFLIHNNAVNFKAISRVFFYTLLAAFVYFLSAKLVAPLSLSESSSIFAIWPPTGVALSFLFFRGYVVVPGIILGAFLLNMTLSTPILACEIAIGNTLGPVVTYWLISKNTRTFIKDDIFYDTDTIIGFIFYSVVGALITSSMGTSMLYLNGFLSHENQFLGWAVWFFGDLIGFMLIAPIFVAYTLQNNISIVSKERIAEIAVILIVLVIFAVIVFGSGYFFDQRYPIEYLVLFPLIWASIRLPYGINLLFLIIVSVFAILGTASGYSQFTFAGDHRLSLIMLQIFIFTVTFAILMMTAQRSYTMRILEEKEQLSQIDSLTQIGNRRYFTKVLQDGLGTSERYKRPLSVIMFDIDHFKQINDAWGHIAGDTVLKELSLLVKSQLRASDHFARWGGEEFVIVLQECVLSDAVLAAEKLRKSVETHPFTIEQCMTCSFGVIQCHEYESFDNILNRVDDKLYEAKETGRNKVVS